MITVTRMATMATVVVVTVRCPRGAAVTRVIVVAGVVTAVLVFGVRGVLVMVSVFRLALRGWGVAGVVLAVVGGVFVHVRLSDVSPLRGAPGSGAGGVAAASQGAGCISLSTTHLWLVMVMPPASTSTT